MSDTITIDQAGRLVLPKAIRDRFRLTGGSRIEVETVGDHVELKPVVDDPDSCVVEENGLLIIAEEGEEFSAVDVIQADRDDRERHLLK